MSRLFDPVDYNLLCNPEVIEDLEKYIIHIQEGGHWIWNGLTKGDTNSPICIYKNMRFPPARLFYIYYNGPLKVAERVYATCGCKRCVNPEHMTIAGYQKKQNICVTGADKVLPMSLNEFATAFLPDGISKYR